MNNDAGVSHTARSKMEVLYRDMLTESDRLIARLERLTAKQEELQQAVDTLSKSVRDIGMAAATEATEYANRWMLDAARTVAKASGELRIATRAATHAFPDAAWRTSLMCMAASFAGGALAGITVLALN